MTSETVTDGLVSVDSQSRAGVNPLSFAACLEIWGKRGGGREEGRDGGQLPHLHRGPCDDSAEAVVDPAGVGWLWPPVTLPVGSLRRLTSCRQTYKLSGMVPYRQTGKLTVRRAHRHRNAGKTQTVRTSITGMAYKLTPGGFYSFTTCD